MSDILRVLLKFENIEELLEVHLVETNLFYDRCSKNYWEI